MPVQFHEKEKQSLYSDEVEVLAANAAKSAKEALGNRQMENTNNHFTLHHPATTHLASNSINELHV